MKIARSLWLVKHFPDPDPAGPVRNSPVDGVPLLIAEDGGADVGAHGVLSGAAVRVFRVDQGYFDLFVVQLQQGPGVHRDDIARHLLRRDDNGSLKLMFELNNGRALLERDQALEPGLVDFGDVDLSGVGHGTFAQVLQIARHRHGK